ncbi:MAG: rRNA adenine N-6-methyltransferase family protein [Candidatus Woesearchaeota archaeon]|nr:rRNA adenine N-6-methyltransferase family protein [Candidatus Woesearchaeota archaeon]
MTSSKALSFDQHFLIDKQAIITMVEHAHLDATDVVLEVGPGKGDITKHIAQQVKKVYAIEIDKSFKPYLDALPDNVEVIYDNILNRIEHIACNKLVANIPFSISEPLLKKIIKTNIARVVLLTGNNFFTILSDKEKKLGKIISLFFDVRKKMELKKEMFAPKPRVLSALIVLEKRTKPLTAQEQLLKELALQDDKKIKNGLLYGLMRRNHYTKNESRAFIAKLNIPDSLLEKNINSLSNRQFKLLCDSLL